MHARTVRIIAGTVVLGIVLVPLVALAGADAVEVTEPVQVSTSTGTEIAYQGLTGAADGYAVAAWTEPFIDSDQVPNLADELWAATRSPSGTWSAPAKVSDTGSSEYVYSLALSSNADGDATIVWRQRDEVTTGTFKQVVYAATLARGASDWSRQRVGGATYGVADFSYPGSATLPDGTGIAAWEGWTGPFDDRQRQIFVNEGDAGGWGSEQQVSGPAFPVNGDVESRDSFDVAVAADGSGAAQVVFVGETDVPLSEGSIHTKDWILRASRTGPGAWASPIAMSSLSPYTYPVSPFIRGDKAKAGFFRGWSEQDAENNKRVRLNGVDSETFTPPAGSTSWSLSGLTLNNGHADALFYNGDADGYTYRVRTLSAGTWGAPSDPTGDYADAVSSGGRPSLATAADGVTSLVWDFGTPRKLYLTQRRQPGGAWDRVRRITAVPSDTSGNFSAGLAPGPDGTVTMLWRRSSGGHALWSAESTVDPPPPVMTVTAPSPIFRTTKSFPVSWKPTTASGPVEDADVKGTVTTWKQAAPSSIVDVVDDGAATGTATFAGAAGRTYCFGARGSGPSGSGDWSPLRCAVVPVDDRTAARSGWTTRTGSGWFLGTYLQTKTKGAKLTWSGAQGKRLALRVAKGSGFGSVKVTFAGQSKTISLAGTAGRYVVPLWSFTSVKSGNVVLTVTTSAKTVRVDGLHVGNPASAFPAG
jgi:hypothetical protein